MNVEKLSPRVSLRVSLRVMEKLHLLATQPDAFCLTAILESR